MSEDTSIAAASGVSTLDSVARLAEIISTAVQHGFGEALGRSLIGQLVLDLEPDPQLSAALEGKPEQVRLRMLLEALGPTFVKFGQIMSMRADLIPPHFTAELETLQDCADPLPFEVIKPIIERSFGRSFDELFERFEVEPLGTASIAQTHRALTRKGEEVVVKVQRPGIQQLVWRDMALLHTLARLVESTIEGAEAFRLAEIIERFKETMRDELDFRVELSNLQRALDNLPSECGATIPRAFPEFSSRTVLTMSYFEGRPLSALEADTPQAHRAAEVLLEVFLEQVLIDGFFHGDLHPGNVLIDDEGELCLIDFGMVGQLTPMQREEMVSLIMGVVTRDTDALARTLIRIGRPDRRVDMSELKAEIGRVQALYTDDYPHNSAAFSVAFIEAAKRFGIRPAPQYALLVRACSTLEAMLCTLHPDIDIKRISRSYAERVLLGRLAPGRLLEQTASSMLGVGSFVRQLPEHLDQIMHDLNTGHFQVEARSAPLDELVPLTRTVVSQGLLAIFASSMSLCAALLLGIGEPIFIEGVPLLGLAALASALLAWVALGLWTLAGQLHKIDPTPWVQRMRGSPSARHTGSPHTLSAP